MSSLIIVMIILLDFGASFQQRQSESLQHHCALACITHHNLGKTL